MFALWSSLTARCCQTGKPDQEEENIFVDVFETLDMEEAELRRWALEEASRCRRIVAEEQRHRELQQEEGCHVAAKPANAQDKHPAELLAAGGAGVQTLVLAERELKGSSSSSLRNSSSHSSGSCDALKPLTTQEHCQLNCWLAKAGFVSVNEKKVIERPSGNRFFYPLHIAVQVAELAVVELLLTAAADPELRDSAGATPLEFARKLGMMNSRKQVLALLSR